MLLNEGQELPSQKKKNTDVCQWLAHDSHVMVPALLLTYPIFWCLLLWSGVTSFNIDFPAKKVTVIGNVTPLGVLASISKVKNAQLWPSSLLPRSSSSSISWWRKHKYTLKTLTCGLAYRVWKKSESLFCCMNVWMESVLMGVVWSTSFLGKNNGVF